MVSLQYPFEQSPPPGTTMEVSPGVRWLRMPLPLALDHINLYLLRDDDGWWIVDTGIGGGKTQELWEQIFANELDGLPIKAVLSTHMHPDHVGQAGWLCERFRVPFYMTRAEFYAARVMSEMPDGLSWTSEQYMRRHGTAEAHIERMRSSKMRMSSMVEPLPMAYRRLRAGQRLRIGGHDWKIMVGEGHSPEHACLYCAELGVLLSGDQVIAGITPNVSVMPTEPEANPMADWLQTLKPFGDLPEDTLVLPAHRLPFYGLRQRVSDIIEHHEDHMVALEKACQRPQLLSDLLPVLFKRELDPSQITMAQGECVAHLHLLMERGLIARELGEDGLYRFRTTDPDIADKHTSPGYQGDDSPHMV